MKLNESDEVSSEYGYIEVGRELDIYEGGVADDEISRKVLDLFLELADSLAVVVELGRYIESRGEIDLGIHLDEADSLLVVRDFL